jgi:D-alanine-D-alanine ligase
MSQTKLRVGILFGGKSVEHEVSLISAKNVIDAMDKDKYEIVLIAIDKQGEWHLKQSGEFLAFAEDAKRVHLHGEKQTLALLPKQERKELVGYCGDQLQGRLALDVIFPILHGPMGEDGTMQGLLTLANIPFVGAGVLGSAIGMDKDVMKRLLRDAKIPIGKFITVMKHQRETLDFESVSQEIGLPFFVKPANAGSSVGVSKVSCESEFKNAMDLAFLYARKVLLEEFIPGREIECSVLGNDHPIASLPGEVIPQHEFYSYEAKYLDEQGALFQIPVQLPPELVKKVQMMSIEVFQALCCEGMARIDFFLKENGDLLVNEINTIPGFTKISMYPKNWEASGIAYSELIDRLIALAIDRHAQESCLATSITTISDIKISEQV